MNPILMILIEAVVLLGAVALLYMLWIRPRIVESARQAAAMEARQTLLDAKEEAMRLREQTEEECRKREAQVHRAEERLHVREEGLQEERRRLDVDRAELVTQLESTRARQEALSCHEEKVEAEMQRIAGLTREQAREAYLGRFEEEFREVAARRAKEIEADIVGSAQAKARMVMLDAMERSAVEYVTEATLAVVDLPSEDMKGRIIGREGRNIRAFEQVTGVDLIIDDTPEAVVISCFDPVRRETARLTLMNLMLDGRIHPVRIEELYEKAQQEVERLIQESGTRAVERAGVGGVPPRVMEALGRLRFRTSYGQNVLDHSVEVAHLSATIAAELGLNVDVARRAGLLHDIGKALGAEWEGPHALAGMAFLKANGEREPVLNAVGAHHNEIEPESAEAVVVIVADSASAARPGARRESLDNYIKRMSNLEDLARSFPGVDRSYAVQAGREVRLIVKPDEIDDLAAAQLAGAVARKIEQNLDYPGQIRVTVIRETRVSDVAR